MTIRGPKFGKLINGIVAKYARVCTDFLDCKGGGVL